MPSCVYTTLYLLIQREFGDTCSPALHRQFILFNLLSIFSRNICLQLNFVFIFNRAKKQKRRHTQQEKRQQAGGRFPLVLLLFFTCDDDAAANLLEKAPNEWNKGKYRNKIPERKY